GAHAYDRRRADVGADEVTGLGHFAFQRDVVPGAAVENPLDLALIDRLIGVDPIGDPREPFRWPNVTLRQRKLSIGVHGGALSNARLIALLGSPNAIPRFTICRRVRDDLR